MRNFIPVMFITLCLALAASPAYCQENGGYQNYLVPVPTVDDLNCAAQPANQYYNPVQQQQFNQFNSPAQVPYAQDNQYGQAFGQNGGQQHTLVSQTQSPSPYQQQEAALEQAQMAQQMEDVKQRKEVDDSFHMSSEFNDKQSKHDSVYDSSKKNKAKTVASGLGRLVKGSMRYAAPAAGTVGSVFLLRAAFGGNMMVMPMGGGMMMVPRP
jgi:hypothetical protein